MQFYAILIWVGKLWHNTSYAKVGMLEGRAEPGEGLGRGVGG